MSFNPCCLGLAVLASAIAIARRDTAVFQSLLSWISRFGVLLEDGSLIVKGFQSLLSWISRFGVDQRRHLHHFKKFQSLLSWISRFGIQILACNCLILLGFNPCCLGLAVLALRLGRRSQALPGFNPCCLGLAVLALKIAKSTPAISVFQSLLSWISRFGLCARPVGSVSRCFNPCCLGLAVLALRLAGMRISVGFQSLLSWISRFGDGDGGRRSFRPPFQSLLSWISRFGSKLLTVVAEELLVSILVVLD